MKKTFTLIICIFALCFHLFALENYLSGARALGLSNACISLSDQWSTFNNQAGVAFLSSRSVGFFYQSRFMVDELSLLSGTAILPVKKTTFGFSFYQFGKGVYKENKMGLAIAKQLNKKLSAGIQLDYFLQTLPENQRAKGFATFEGGVIFSPFEQIVLGAHLFNPIQAGIQSVNGKIPIPAVYRIGGHYQFDKFVLFIIEVQKDSQNPIQLKTGLEFSPAKNIYLRFGASGKPINYTAGFGYKTGKISTDIGFSYHGNLGITPSVSVQFDI